MRTTSINNVQKVERKLARKAMIKYKMAIPVTIGEKDIKSLFYTRFSHDLYYTDS